MLVTATLVISRFGKTTHTQQKRRTVGPLELNDFGYDLKRFPSLRTQSRETCGMLASQIANSPERTTISVESLEYICFKNDSFKFNQINLTLQSLTKEKIAILTSEDSRIFVGNTNILISNLIFLGGWKIFVGENSSLTLRDIVLDQVSISIAKGASLSIEGLTASRSVGTYPAVEIFVSEAYIDVVDTLIQDDLDGTLLSISGDDSIIILRNTTVQAAQPQPKKM